VTVLPLFLSVEGRAVLVCGGGPAVERKVVDLVAAGARVRLVAPRATEALERMARRGTITWDARPYAEADLEGVWLVVSATNDPEAARAIFAQASARQLFVLAVDDPENGSASSGSVITRPPFVIAISSSGETPALTRLLREVLEHALPDDRFIEAARELRARWRAEGTPMASRFPELVRLLNKKAAEPE
jgi:siroheme synthase-like protein